ncbi:MAG: hypothetical protein GXP54_01365 [Deltaproteobacteria bacterium]|nr:hypothetical protein [Deltaproteobacteria bacterium]
MKIPWFAWVLVVFWSAEAFASGFAGNELWVGRSVKQSKKERDFTIGIDAKFSPWSLGSKTALDSAITDACAGSGIPNCESTARSAWQALGTVSDSAWAQLESVATDTNKLASEMSALGIPQDQIKVVTDYVNSVPPDERKDAIGLARDLSNPKVNILLDPFLSLNFDLVEFQLTLPMIIAVFDSRTDFTLGNVNTDIKFGHLWDYGVATIGLSYGMHLYFPSAYEKYSNTAALADLFNAPKFMHGYFSFAPYIVTGFDLPFITIQAYAEIDSMHAVWGDTGASNLQFFKYGAGITILPDFVISIIAELDGMVPIHNADAFNTLFAVGGLRLNIVWFSFSAAVQTPVYGWDRDFGSSLGIKEVNQLSRLNVIGRFAFIF